MSTKLFRRHFIFRRMLAAAGVLISGLGAKMASGEEEKKAKWSKKKVLNETIETIHSLRTIHGNFTDREIPEGQLKTILHSSVRAANASNMQSYLIVVVKDREMMKKVCGYQGSCMLVYCVDHNRPIASAKSLGHTYCPDNINDFITASTNTILACQTAAIAARSLGIDYLITNGVHRGDMSRQWELLDLPKTHCYPLIAMVLGYPTEEPKAQKGRLSDVGVIHYEKYHLPNLAELKEITQQYDDPSTHLALNDGWKDAGHEHYLDWFFTKWLGRNAKPGEKETQMFALLKRSGYVDLQKS